MKTSRIALIVLSLAALTAVGFSAAGSEPKAKATEDCSGHCSDCGDCCKK